MIEIIDWHSLSTEERASLTEEDVRAYCRVAAMEAGVVLSTMDTEFLPEEQPELAYGELWVIEADDMPSGIAFRKKGDAQAFLALDVIGVNTKYLGAGYATTIKVIRPLTGMTLKRSEDFLTETEYERARVALDEYGNNVKHNAELRSELDKRNRAFDMACEYIWVDYRSAKARLLKLEEVGQCWKEYQELAKDLTSAIVFMNKAYPDDKELVCEALGNDWDTVCEGHEVQL